MEEKETLVDKLILGLDVLTQKQIQIIGNSIDRCAGVKKSSGGDEWMRSDLLHYLNSIKEEPDMHTPEIFLFLGLMLGTSEMMDFYKNLH